MIRDLLEGIAVLIILSVIRTVLTALHRRMGGGQRRTPARNQGSAAGPATPLQQDPVCGTYVAIDSSLKRIVHGKVIHFCSPECRDKFEV